jgi:hypothetical protein
VLAKKKKLGIYSLEQIHENKILSLYFTPPCYFVFPCCQHLFNLKKLGKAVLMVLNSHGICLEKPNLTIISTGQPC